MTSEGGVIAVEVQRDGTKLKGHGIGFLEKDIGCTQVFAYQCSQIGRPML